MAELYAKPFETVETGYNPQQPQQDSQQKEMEAYLSSLPPEERQAAIERINAPLTGEELALMANSGEKLPTLDEYAEIEKFHKNHEISFIDGLGKIAEGGEQVMNDLSNAFASMINDPSGTATKMPATAVEAFAQGTRNFYGMLAQSQNPDSVLFRVKDFLNGTGTLEDRYNQYIEALKFNRQSAELVEGKQTLVMDKDLINHEVTQAMAYIADPTLFIPFGKVASTGLRAVGLGEKLTMAGARAAAIKNGIIGNTLKWGAGQPLEFLGGAVRNTIDYGLERAGSAFEATTGIAAKEFAQTARMSGIGFSASAVAGHAVPYASTISDAYLVGSSARGFGEALTLLGETMKKNQFGRGINSWAAEALEQAEKNGVALSPHAKGLLKTLNAVDPLFAYGWNGLETAAEGAVIGGGLGYASGGAEGMYSGIGAGIALGGIGGTAGKVVADVTGGTGVARRAVQAKMVIEGHKVTNPEKAMFFQAMQAAAEARGKDVDLVNSIIAGIDKVAPNFEFHALTPEEFAIEAIKRGYDPDTGKFVEYTKNFEGFGDRESKRRALSILRGLGGDFVGDRKAFLEALQKHGKVFTPEEIQKLTRDYIVSARARQLLMRYGFVNPKGGKTPWSQIDTPAQKKYLDGLLKGLSPEERAEVIKQYESVSSYEGQQEFIKNVDLSKDDLFDIQQNKGRRSSKYNPIIDSFNKLNKLQQEAVLKEIDGQAEFANRIGGKHKLREFYEARAWAEAWTDSIVKKFETDRQGAWADIRTALSQETKKNGERTLKGRNLVDKLTAEGFLDRDGNVLRERNLLNADMTFAEFAFSKGGVLERKADGKTHMYINLASMGDETFPHELYHTIMRESPMKKHFTDNLIQKLIGTFDKDGNLVRPAEVSIEQVKKFFKKYIDLTHRNNDGTLNSKAAEAKFIEVEKALLEYQQTGENKKISDRARSLIENYTEEFGAYYFSHWLMGRNRNTLFFGGELKGIEGVVERVKDSFKDFWQSKISKNNPEFDFSRGLNDAFDRRKGLGRIAAIDYFMRDMLRAASNANKEVFRPDSMTLENLRDFERSNGLRNLTTPEGTRRLNPREQVTQNIRLGKEAYKILSGLDKNLRTSKDVLDENGKQVITGRLSEAELDALVKGGIVPRAWADKVNQGYAMLDGTVSNIFSAGYLGRTEQTTDASYPRLTGKDVSFKNRKAVLFDVETKIKADGTFYTLFHTLDLAVIEQRANHLWQNADYRMLWNNDRGAMEADFFKYISNASKASTDSTKRDSATLLDMGDGKGGQRRDVLHQMAGMALQTGDAYKHQPIAVIPEGIRHSVTTFNIDGMTMPRIETGTRYDINMGNAHKFIRENWQPDEMRQEKTPSGTLFTHETGFKFSSMNGKTAAYTSAGKKIGVFDSIKQATEAAKREYRNAYNNIDAEVDKQIAKQREEIARYQPLDEKERQLAIVTGDLFSIPSVQEFINGRPFLRHARDEFIFEKAEKALKSDDELKRIIEQKRQEYSSLIDELNKLYEKEKLNLAEYKNLILADPFAEISKFYRDRGIDITGLNSGRRLTIEEQKQVMELDEKYNLAKLELDQKKVENQKVRIDIAEARKKIKKQLEKDGVETFVNFFDQKTIDSFGLHPAASNDLFNVIKQNIQEDLRALRYAGLLESLFAKEYDDQIQTGKPIVILGTHGTQSPRMAITRAYSDAKLGARYGDTAFSSTLGHFMGNSSMTSDAYAGSPRFGFGHIGGFGTFRFTDISHRLMDRMIMLEKRISDTNPKSILSPEAKEAAKKELAKLKAQEKKLSNLFSEATRAENEATFGLIEEAGRLYNYLHKNLDTISNEKAIIEASRILTILRNTNASNFLSNEVYIRLKNGVQATIKKKLGKEIVGEVNRLKPDSTLESLFDDYKELIWIQRGSDEKLGYSKQEEIYGTAFPRTKILKNSGSVIDRSNEFYRKVHTSISRAEAMSDMLLLLDSSDIAKDYGLREKFDYAKESGMNDMYDGFLNQYLEATTIERIVNETPYKKYIDYIRELHKEHDFQELIYPELKEAYPEASETTLRYSRLKVRALMAFDNPMVVVDPRSYEEHFIAPHMLRAIKNGHDGIIFKRFADGGEKDNIIVSFKGNTKKIMEIDTTLDEHSVPRKNENGELIKQNFQPTDESEAPKRVQGIKLDLTKAYDVFRREYEESTGQSWSMGKFMQRASNWQFFGDENGFVAVRPQRSGFVKLVGMAGDNKSKLRGIQQIQQMGLPVWGMVSKDIKDIAVKRGMREPNMIERTLLKQALNSAALGDAEILGYTPDNGVRLRYPDIGEVTKYMVGSPEYYQKLRSAFGEQIKNKIGFQPDEPTQGGRTYTDEEFKSKFIGRVAAEDPDITEGLRVEATNNDLKLIDENGTVIGRINSWHDAQDMIAKSGEAEIIPSYRGMGYGKLLYSEFMERLRAQGKSEFRGTIADEKNRPIKIRESIAGNTKFEVYDTVTNTYKFISSQDGRLSQSRYERTGRVSNALDPKAWYQPDEPTQGGRVYDPKSREFRTKFIGKWAEENPDKVKGYNIEFIDRGGMGGYRNPNAQNVRIRMQDNSKKGSTIDVGHITAQIDHNSKVATLSSNIAPEYRGNKLSYALYSEMAERLRSMGIKYVDGQIVNPDGIPVRVREKIIGDTRMLARDGSYQSSRPITQKEASTIIKRRQAMGGQWEGIDVVNELDFNARYQPDDYHGGDDYYKPKKNRFESRDGQGMLVRKYAIEDKDGNMEFNPEALTYVQIGHGNSPLGYYEYKNVEINGKEYRLNDILYFINKDGKFISKKMTPEDNKIHSQYAKDSSEISMAMHPLGYKYADAIQGRIEMPIYEKGKLVRRGVASILDIAKDKINSSSDVIKAKNKIAKELKINAEDFDLHLFEAPSEIKSQRGYGDKDQLAIKFQPTEGEQGGRTYTDKQMENEFIGKYANENQHITKGLSIEYWSPDYEPYSGVDGDLDTSKFILKIEKSGDLVGEMSAEFERSSTFFNGEKDVQGLILRDISIHLEEKHRGKGYQHLFYSELLERARAQGAIGFTQNVENKLGLPIKSINKIVGKDGSKIWTLRDWSPVEPTQENFDRLMSRAPQMKDYRGNHAEYVQNNGKLDPNAWYQPAEGEQGGRTYTDKQMASEFIGRYAAENAKVTKGLKPKFSIFGSGDQGNIELMKGQDSIGYINFSFSKATGDALIEYTNVARGQQGKGYGNLLYSELVERLRSMGMKEVQGMIIDERGRPQKIRERIIDRENARIGGDRTQIDYVEKDPDSDATHTGVTSYLYNKAWYQPDENPMSYVPKTERAKELLSIINSIPHYKEAFESGQLTIDAYKAEDFKDYFMLSHAPDTASTVDSKFFKGQGGIGYPLLFKGEGWAAVSRGLEKRINAIGKKNLEKHGKFLAPVALVMSHAEKMKSAINGTDAFVNVIKTMRDKKVITDEILRQALIKGLTNAGVDYVNENTLLADVLWKTKTKFLKFEGSGFKSRAKFVKDVAGSIAVNSEKLNPRQIKALKEIIPDYEGKEKITSKHLIPSIFKMFEDPMLRGIDAPDKKTGGDVYAFVLFDKPLVESENSPHGSYKFSVRHEDNSPVRVDILSNPIHTMTMFDKAVTKKGQVPLVEKTVVNKTGQRNFPYGDVKHHQPSEYTEFKSEQSPMGRIMRNAKGYVITMANNKFRVYNPAKAIIGVYGSEEEAKKRIYREIPKQ